MNEKKVNDFLDVMFMDATTEEKLQKLGISKEDFDRILKRYVPNSIPYRRIFTMEEQNSLEPAAYEFLYQLLKMESITRDLFERLLFFSKHLSSLINRKVDRYMIDEMLNFVFFSEKDIKINDFIDLYINKPNFDQIESIE